MSSEPRSRPVIGHAPANTRQMTTDSATNARPAASRPGSNPHVNPNRRSGPAGMSGNSANHLRKANPLRPRELGATTDLFSGRLTAAKAVEVETRVGPVV